MDPTAHARFAAGAKALLVLGLVGAILACLAALMVPILPAEWAETLVIASPVGWLLIGIGLAGAAWALSSVLYAAAAALNLASAALNFALMRLDLQGEAVLAVDSAVGVLSSLALAVALLARAPPRLTRLAAAASALVLSAAAITLPLRLHGEPFELPVELLDVLLPASNALWPTAIGMLALVFLLCVAERRASDDAAPIAWWTLGGIGALFSAVALAFFHEVASGYGARDGLLYAALIGLGVAIGLFGLGFLGHRRQGAGAMAWVAAAAAWAQPVIVPALGYALIDSRVAAPAITASVLLALAIAAVAYLLLGRRPLGGLAIAAGVGLALAAVVASISVVLYLRGAPAGRVETAQDLAAVAAVTALFVSAGYQLARVDGMTHRPHRSRAGR